ncbi:MAG: hypothetical protein RJB38_2070 [Pseudomonadota bacterium]|jgi:cytochrome b
MVRFWDPLVRLLHWGWAAIIILNQWVLEDGGPWHERLGYWACAFVLIRVFWGFFGSKNARFSEILKAWPPRGQFVSHLKSYLAHRNERYLNHPPLAMIVMSAMLSLVLALGLTGWLMDQEAFFGVEWVEETHEALASILIALVFAHVAGVLRASFLERENLIASMIHGKKRQ